METSKDKAKKLADKYYNEMNPNQPDCNISWRQAIECAKIAVDEILNDIPDYLGGINPKRFYWQEVKNELNKL